MTQQRANELVKSWTSALQEKRTVDACDLYDEIAELRGKGIEPNWLDPIKAHFEAWLVVREAIRDISQKTPEAAQAEFAQAVEMLQKVVGEFQRCGTTKDAIRLVHAANSQLRTILLNAAHLEDRPKE